MVAYLAVLPAASPTLSISSKVSSMAAASFPSYQPESARIGRPQDTRHPPVLRLRGGDGPAEQQNSKGTNNKRKEVVPQTDDERVEEIKRLLDETKLSLEDLQYLLKYHGMCSLPINFMISHVEQKHDENPHGFAEHDMESGSVDLHACHAYIHACIHTYIHTHKQSMT